MSKTLTGARDDLVIRAKLCDAVGRHDKMVEVIDELVQGLPKQQTLTQEERIILSVAYKNEISKRRQELRRLSKAANNLKSSNVRRRQLAIELKETLAGELERLSLNLIHMLDSKLLPAANEVESYIFYHKLKGDYLRYLIEIEHDEDRLNDYMKQAEESYQDATRHAITNLASTHPLRISLAMNYSVFIHDMLKDTNAALQLAKRFYNEAMDELENVKKIDENKYQECAPLLRLLHANIELWLGHTVTQTMANNF